MRGGGPLKSLARLSAAAKASTRRSTKGVMKNWKATSTRIRITMVPPWTIGVSIMVRIMQAPRRFESRTSSQYTACGSYRM